MRHENGDKESNAKENFPPPPLTCTFARGKESEVERERNIQEKRRSIGREKEREKVRIGGVTRERHDKKRETLSHLFFSFFF